MKAADNINITKARALSTCFWAVFLAFSVTQNYQTSSDHKSEGSNALGILYGCFTLTNLAASFIVTKFGPRLCLGMGALTYAGFVASNIHFNAYALYFCSATIGFGASIIWTAQGVTIARCAAHHEYLNNLPENSSMGFFQGTFWAIFQCNQLTGNLLVALLFWQDVEQWVIFVILTVICTCGSIALFFCQQPDRVPEAADAVARKVTLLDTLSLLRDKRMLLLIPIMMFAGLSQTFAFGEFPPLVESKSLKFFVLALIGGCNALFSFAFGRMSDRLGRLPVLVLGFVAFGAAIIFLAIWDVQQQAGVFFAVGVIIAVGDAVYNTQVSAILGTYWEKEAESAFACFKLFQAGSTAVAFLYHNHVGFVTKAMITLGFLVVGMILTTYLHYRVAPLNGPTHHNAITHIDINHADTDTAIKTAPLLASDHVRSEDRV